MTRVASSNYTAAGTQFRWATSDADLFDRSDDLYLLAQALENHDHSSTRGVAVARMAAGSITATMYGALSIPTGAIQDLAVTTAKIADAAITDAKLATAKYPLTGGIIQGNVQLAPLADPTVGTIFFGNSGIMYLSVTNSPHAFNLYNGFGGANAFYGDLYSIRTGAQTTGYIFFGNGGNYIGFNGTDPLFSGNLLYHAGNAVMVPAGAIVAFRTAAEITVAGAHWLRESSADGRFLIGAGTSGTTPKTFSENTLTGTYWEFMTGVGVSAGTLANNPIVINASASSFLAAASAANNPTGATNVSTAAHTHTVSGGDLIGAPTLPGATTQQWVPPSQVVVWARRV